MISTLRKLPTYYAVGLKIIATILLLVVLVGSSDAQAPSDDTQFDFIPSAPNAAALGEYGSNPVDLSNGAANVSIPVYTFRSKNISVPISISHRTSGLKVDERESFAGLGWVLNAGGVINRTIMDVADEANLGKQVPYPENANMSDYEMLKYIERNDLNRDFDTQQDEFNFNFMGYSGKFFFDRLGKPIIAPKTNLIVERHLDQLGNGEIIITTPDGSKYYFGGDYTEITSMTSAGGTGCSKNFDNKHRVSAWYLYKVTHLSGASVFFDYEVFNNLSITQSLQRTETRLYAKIGANCGECDNFSESRCRTLLEVQQGVKLIGIRDEHISVDFKSTNGYFGFLKKIEVKDEKRRIRKSFGFEYESVSPNMSYDTYNPDASSEPKYFLKKFFELDVASSDTLSSYHLAYYNLSDLPPRFSYAQDHWGYFNGVINQDFLPVSDHHLFDDDFTNDPLGAVKSVNAVANREPDFNYAISGSLKAISYPTGGKTTFEYQGHSVHGATVNETTATASVEAADTLKDTSVVTLVKNETVDVYMNLIPGANASMVKPCKYTIAKQNTGEVIYTFSESINPGDPAFSKMAQVPLTAGSYVVEVDLESQDVTAQMYFTYTFSSSNVSENKVVGGLRIAKMIDDPLEGPAIVKRYEYNRFNTLQSSGVLMGEPYYLSRIRSESTCGVNVVGKFTCHSMMLNSTSSNKMFNAGGSHITYPNVTIIHGENGEYGKEEVYYRVYTDASARLVHGERIQTAPYSDRAWGNGLELERHVYKNEGGYQLIKRVKNLYTEDNRGYEEVKNLLIQKRYNPANIKKLTYVCDESNIDLEYQYLTCTTKHEHLYLYGSSYLSWICIKSGANNTLLTYKYHPCYGKQIGETGVDHGAYEHFDIMEYTRASWWHYAYQTIETEFDDQGDSLVSVVNYQYDNPEHLQLTRTSMHNSEGEELVDWVYYPQDYNAGVGNLDAIKAANLTLPIKSIKEVDGKQVAGEVYVYNEIGQPVAQYSFRSEEPIVKPDHDSTEYVPDQYELVQTWTYNADFNLIQHQRVDDVSVTFIWGYSGRLPVARIDNATYAEIDALNLSWETNDSGPLSESDVSVIRLQLPDAMITTYEYDLLDGVTSITNPNEIDATFKYRNGRFREQRDHNNDVLKLIEYNFSSSSN